MVAQSGAVRSAGGGVAVLSHLQRAQADQQYAVVHVLRFLDSAIVEMWDIAQEIPADSPNALGMF